MRINTHKPCKVKELLYGKTLDGITHVALVYLDKDTLSV